MAKRVYLEGEENTENEVKSIIKSSTYEFKYKPCTNFVCGTDWNVEVWRKTGGNQQMMTYFWVNLKEIQVQDVPVTTVPLKWIVS